MNGNLDKKNGFLYAKAAVAALCGAFTAAFGWLGWLVLALLLAALELALNTAHRLLGCKAAVADGGIQILRPGRPAWRWIG